MSSTATRNDYMLNAFIGMAETGASMGITLYSNGLVISGNLISQKLYAEKLVSSLRGPMGEAFGSTSDRILDSIGLIADIPNGRASNDDEPADCEFVHLSEAKIFMDSNLYPAGQSVWRGKISSIDGFALGVMQVS